MQKIVSTICTYCGCACRLNFVIDNGKIVKVLPDPTDKVSEGKPCIKGLTLHEVIQKDRILKPMTRKYKSSPLKEVSWDEAYNFIYEKTKDLSPEEVFFAPSGKTTNEDCYIMQKFARTVFKTNNVDGCCTRLCHIATVKALIDTFGNGAIPTKMDDTYDIDCLFIIGSNPASNYPVMFNRILKARKKMKIISVQNIENLTSQFADIKLIIQPGTNIVFLNGIMNELIHRKAYDKNVEKVTNFSNLYEIVKKYPSEIVCEFCKISKEEFIKVVDTVEDSRNLGVMHGMGVTQHTSGTANVHSLLNLLILKNGKLLSGRGEVNVQGVGDMGCLPDSMSSVLINQEIIESVWKTKLSRDNGKNMVEALITSPVKAAFISGFNPAQSLPNLDRVHENLSKIFLVQLEPHLNLTSDFADVILPTPTLVERNGTITNGERRVRRVIKTIEPMGMSKPEWIIFKELAKLFESEKFFTYNNEKEITDEISKTIPAYRNIDVDSIYEGNDNFADKEIEFVKFNPEEFKGKKDIRTKEYPFILTTFRSQHHFLTGELTTKSETLSKSSDGAYCYMNEEDAKKLEIKDGNTVEVSSCVSKLITKAKIDKRIPKGIVGMYFHFKELLVNKLFPTEFDEKMSTPNYKMVAVQIKKVY